MAGPFGGFDYRTGGPRQLWIAGGIGVTPFMSWIRSLDASFDRDVDFYYSVSHKSDALFAEEVAAAGERHPTFRPHIVVTEGQSLLTAEGMLGSKGRDLSVWVYMCGPPPMTAALAKGFRRLGVPSGRIRWEQFDVR